MGLFIRPPEEALSEIEKRILSPARKMFEELNAPQIVFNPDWLHVSLLLIMTAEVQPPLDPSTTRLGE